MAHKAKSLYRRLRVHMRGTIYTLHYILSKGAMKCVWGIVSVHVSLHGISDRRCRYKVFANEFCQRQLWTWCDGQRRDENLALCGLGRCCIATPASFRTPCLTCAACPGKKIKRQASVPLSALRPLHQIWDLVIHRVPKVIPGKLGRTFPGLSDPYAFVAMLLSYMYTEYKCLYSTCGLQYCCKVKSSGFLK